MYFSLMVPCGSMLPRCSDLSNFRTASSFQDEELIAEEFPISIQPHFNTGEPLRFISQECGPFDRRSATSVPLWVALYLERHGKCSIIHPEWLSVAFFKQKIREERERGTGTFASIDDQIIQVACILLNRDHLTAEYLGGQMNRNQMSTILTELLMIRKAKMIEGLKQIDVTTSIVDITNMTAIERANIRPQGSKIMDSLRDLWTIRESVIGVEPRGM